MALQAVLFDLDGTLIDSHDDIFAAFAAVAREMDLPAPPASALRSLMGLPLALMFRALYGDLPDDRVEQLSSAYRRQYGAHMTERTRIFPGVQEALLALAPLALGVATTKRSLQALQVIAAVGLDAHFNVVQGTDGFPAKPAPDVLQRALARLGVPAQRAAYVGDGPWDMQAARAGGLYAIGIDHAGDRTAALDDAGAAAVLRDMRQLPPLIAGLS
ncbi:MAG: HAD-IA family hydrolase [Thermaerobacter sp.]|nr:HAD-IA family hydrolase [Thermaerobacter sp.]